MRHGKCRVLVSNGVQLLQPVEVVSNGRRSKMDGSETIVWLDRIHKEEKERNYQEETSGMSSSWALIEEFYRLGVMPSQGKRKRVHPPVW